MSADEPDMVSSSDVSGSDKAARKLNSERANKFAKRRAAAKKAAETRRSITGPATKNLGLMEIRCEQAN